MNTSPDIFLSYSREDQSTARRFAESLEAQGFTVWWDATLRAGESFDQAIEKALNEAKAVVVLWSKNSVNSRWVRAEATEAVRNQTLAPVIIEPCKRPIIFELTHTADLSHWNGDLGDPAWKAYVADVRRLVEKGAPEKSVLETKTLRLAPVRAATVYRNRTALIAISLLLIVGAAGLLYAFRRPVQPAVSTLSSAPATPNGTQAGASLAVLPFVDMSPQHDQDYFSDGLSEELLNELAQIKDLQVAGRTSSFSFKGKNEDLRSIGEQLGVNHLLEGSVRKEGKELRITAQLIDANTGKHLWSQTYDRKLANVFAVQEEIAKAVAAALSVKLGVGNSTAVAGGTGNAEAYDNYLRARALAFQYDLKGNTAAIASYRKALALDPNYARAWYGLLIELGSSARYSPQNAIAINAEARQVRAHLLALAPDSSVVQIVTGSQLVKEHKWAEADATIAMLTTSWPSDASAMHFAGANLTAFGRVQEASVYMERASKLEPLALGVSQSLQIGLDLAGRRTEATSEYQRSKSLTGDHTLMDVLALARVWSQADADPVLVQSQLRVLKQPIGAVSIAAFVPDRPDDKADSLIQIRKALADPTERNTERILAIAILVDHFGDKDLLIAALRKVDAVYGGGSNAFFWWPWETGIRSDPRFKQLLRDVKLASYFRTTGKWGDFCHPVGEDDFECR